MIKQNLKINGLEYGQNYKLTLGSNTWKNKYGYNVNDLSVEFMTTGKVFVKSVGLYDGEAELTNGRITSGSITLKAEEIKNMTGETQNAIAFVMLYKDGKLVNTGGTKIEIEPNGEIKSSEVSIPVAADDGKYIIKAFVWDSIRGGKSLVDGVTWRN